MIIDFNGLRDRMIGNYVPRPLVGTLSGHAAGEPFSNSVYEELRKMYPGQVFKQYEYLNSVYSRNTDAQSVEARYALFESPTILFLLSRGKDATGKWSIDNIFQEKQDDTADVLIYDGSRYEIVDIKTRNLAVKAQPPNIISAYKLANLCAITIDNDDYDIYDLHYVEVGWELREDKLICKDIHVADMFKADPAILYINWAAAMQIQFHVSKLSQQYEGDLRRWTRAYLRHFVNSAKERADEMIIRFVRPFEKYVD